MYRPEVEDALTHAASFPDGYFDIKVAIAARGDADPMVVSHITLGHLAPQLKSFLKS